MAQTFKRLSHPGDVPHLAVVLKRQISDIQDALAPIDSPVFTGDPQAPTPPTPDNDTSIATTAFVKNQNYAPLASPTFTGDPKAPTPASSDNDTSIATTAFVHTAVAAAGSANMSGMVAGQIPIAASATSVTSSVATLVASFMPAYTGDVTSPAGSTINTLATVNANVGTWNNVTVNGKGLVTAGSNAAYVTGGPYLPLAGGTLTGPLSVAGQVTANSLNFSGSLTGAAAPYIAANGGNIAAQLSAANGAYFFFNGGGAVVAEFDGASKSCFNTSGTWAVLSDPRTKTDIGPYTAGLQAVLGLNPITFRYNGALGSSEDDPDVTRYGLDAQATRAVMPELVLDHSHEGESVLALDNGPIIYALVNAVKELVARIEMLETRA